MKVKITDYQIIEDAELEFPVGITSIIGSTNNGKSALIRAIKGAINNQGGSSFINYNANETVVAIDFNSNNIIWTKSKKQGKSSYTINDDKYDKIGQTQLKEVADIMNMPEISVGTERHQINFWKQLDKPFLIDKTPYQLFEFIANSKEQEQVDKLKQQTEVELKGIKRHVEDNHLLIDNYKKEIPELTKESELYDKLSKYNPVTLKSAETLATETQDGLILYDSLNEDIAYYNEELEKINSIISKLEPMLEEIKSHNSLRESLIALFTQMEVKERLVDELRVRTFDNNVEFYEEQAEKLNNSILQYNEQVNSAKSIKDLFIKYNSKNSEYDSLKIKYNNTIKELDKYTEELSQFKTCPLCGLSLETGGEHGLH